jgi:hypothetical protein
MRTAQQRARFDWLVELGGASVLAAAGGYAALKLAPSLAFSGATAMVATGFSCFASGMLMMRATRPGPRQHVLAEFAIEPIGTDELLLDKPIEEPLLLDTPYKEDPSDVLLLDNALPEYHPTSRVIELFASPQMPTPGQVKERIDRHLAGAPRRTLPDEPLLSPDASEALYAALNELRRSLR